MKILVLEGLNAVGKTTLSQELETNYGYLRLRAFEGQQPREKAQKMGVMANTFLDDMYIADFLRQVHRWYPEAKVVLDRSIPSAFVYQNGSVKVDGLKFWHEMLMEAAGGESVNLNFIWMRASREFLNERHPGSEMSLEDYEMLDSMYGVVIRTLAALGTPIREMDVEEILTLEEQIDKCNEPWEPPPEDPEEPPSEPPSEPPGPPTEPPGPPTEPPGPPTEPPPGPPSEPPGNGNGNGNSP